jgi:ElaB/YqjD/DUF883 family membrane-anchored ribosome-binding protein
MPETNKKHDHLGGAPATGATGVLEAAKGKAQDAAANVADLAGQAKDKVQDMASCAADAAGRARDQAQEVMGQAADRACAMARNAGDDIAVMVRRYPVQAVLIGLAAGFLLGRVSRT